MTCLHCGVRTRWLERAYPVSYTHLDVYKRQIQLYVRRDELGEEPYAAFKKLDVGDIIGVKGEVFRTKTCLLYTSACYVLGTAWFVFQMQCELGYALSVCVYPFIALDLAKIVVSCIVGALLRKRCV